MVGIAVLAALVVVLQLLSSVIKIGTVSITLTLIPIVVGAAFYGPGAGAILGTVFGLVVYINSATGADYGGNMVFLANPFLCAVVCIGKGTLSGTVSRKRKLQGPKASVPGFHPVQLPSCPGKILPQ